MLTVIRLALFVQEYKLILAKVAILVILCLIKIFVVAQILRFIWIHKLEIVNNNVKVDNTLIKIEFV